MSHIKASFALIASLQGIRQPPDASCVESSMSSVSCPRCLRSVPSYDGYAAGLQRRWRELLPCALPKDGQRLLCRRIPSKLRGLRDAGGGALRADRRGGARALHLGLEVARFVR